MQHSTFQLQVSLIQKSLHCLMQEVKEKKITSMLRKNSRNHASLRVEISGNLEDTELFVEILLSLKPSISS